jgi:hypothetical protein
MSLESRILDKFAQQTLQQGKDLGYRNWAEYKRVYSKRKGYISLKFVEIAVILAVRETKKEIREWLV